MAAFLWMQLVSDARLNDDKKEIMEIQSKGSEMLVFIRAGRSISHFMTFWATRLPYGLKVFPMQYVPKSKASLRQSLTGLMTFTALSFF